MCSAGLRELHVRRKRQLAIALVMGALGSFGTAIGKDAYDGDTPLYRCSGHDEFDRLGNHWLRSGEESSNTERTAGAGTWAAMHWITGWPGEGDDLTDIEDHAEVVPPRGARLPVIGIRQAASEVLACWVLKPLEAHEERPPKLRDARKLLEVTCPTLPANLQTALPILVDAGHVRIDARKGLMNFFGADLRLVRHVGSAYVGISKDFAVTLHKSSGNFRIVLPQGRGLDGSCGFLPAE